MMTEDQAEKLYDKIIGYTYSEFSSEEHDLIRQVLHSEVLLKALGMMFYYIEICKSEVLNIDMSESGSAAKIAKIQGRTLGVQEGIQGLIRLVTEQEMPAGDKEEENVSSAPSLN